jgi:long-chain acyl-CoA synthetase
MQKKAEADAERASIARISLGDIVRRSARRHPDKVPVIEGNRRITFSALDAASERVGEALRDHGLTGRRIATMCVNSTEHLTAIQAIHKSGNVWVPVNVQLDAASIEHVLSHAEVSGVFIDAALFAVAALRALVERLGLLTVVIGPHEATAGTLQFDALASRPPAQPLAVAFGDDDLALIMYTSGTTGKQKGVMHSHRSVHVALLTCAQSFEATERDVVVSVLPLFHCAQHAISTGALMVGASLWLANGFDPKAMLAAIARERVSWLSCLPMMFDVLMKHPERPRTDFSSLRMCMYGLAPMPRRTCSRRCAARCAPTCAWAPARPRCTRPPWSTARASIRTRTATAGACRWRGWRPPSWTRTAGCSGRARSARSCTAAPTSFSATSRTRRPPPRRAASGGTTPATSACSMPTGRCCSSTARRT